MVKRSEQRSVNDVLLNKAASIQRCIQQVRRYDAFTLDVPFEIDQLKQDAIAANLHRACEQSIDLANHVIRRRRLGIPEESRDSFILLAEHQLIERDLAEKLASMADFRNTLMREYQQLDLTLFRQVIDHHLDDLLLFSELMVKKMAAAE
ncbi:MAG: DUF86 domain-containing protein [Magnetococcales bacterium]|nr:DUF86 domain-containing protein [Magnetococcales bacterium]